MKIAEIAEGITAIAIPGEIAMALALSDYDLFIVNGPEPLQPEVGRFYTKESLSRMPSESADRTVFFNQGGIAAPKAIRNGIEETIKQSSHVPA